jgi:hypothetical protein
MKFYKTNIYLDILERIQWVDSVHAAGYNWPKLKQDALELCQKCLPCLRFNNVPKGYYPLQQITADQPFDHVAVDLAGPFPTSNNGNHYLHVLIDIHSRFILLHALENKQMLTIALLWRDIFTTFGFPKIIQSDNGTEFVNQIVKTMIEASGIDHRLVTPYHPRANGAAEKSVQTSTKLIKKLLMGVKKNWDIYVPFVQYCINQKIISRHQKTPFEVIFGRRSNAFADFTDSIVPSNFEIASSEHNKFIQEIQQRITHMQDVLFPTVTNTTKIKNAKIKQKFDSKHKIIDVPLNSFVMIKDNLRKSKLDPENEGPFKIINKTKNGTYILEDLEGQLLPRNYPSSFLIPLSSDPQFGQSSYEISAIIDHKKTSNGYKYLVRWKNYTKDEDTWEPEDNFDDVEIINKYWNRRGKKN